MAGEHPQQPERRPEVHSGDTSGKGRERRDDSDVFPKQRNAGEFGTHGGPKNGGKEKKKDAGGDAD